MKQNAELPFDGDDVISGANISPCGQYRYGLWRIWDNKPCAIFVMLNPSTADAVTNDPTITRCEKRARLLGYGGLVVVNLFALRSTDPAALLVHPDPVGPENDTYINRKLENAAGIVICGWGGGEYSNLGNRAQKVLALIRAAAKVPHYLKLNKDGSPGHPLYIGYKVKPQEWVA